MRSPFQQTHHQPSHRFPLFQQHLRCRSNRKFNMTKARSALSPSHIHISTHPTASVRDLNMILVIDARRRRSGRGVRGHRSEIGMIGRRIRRGGNMYEAYTFHVAEFESILTIVVFRAAQSQINPRSKFAKVCRLEFFALNSNLPSSSYYEEEPLPFFIDRRGDEGNRTYGSIERSALIDFKRYGGTKI